MISFLKKFLCKLNANKTTKEKNKEDCLFFATLNKDNLRRLQNASLKSFTSVEQASKALELLSKCGNKATDFKHNV